MLSDFKTEILSYKERFHNIAQNPISLMNLIFHIKLVSYLLL